MHGPHGNAWHHDIRPWDLGKNGLSFVGSWACRTVACQETLEASRRGIEYQHTEQY